MFIVTKSVKSTVWHEEEVNDVPANVSADIDSRAVTLAAIMVTYSSHV